MADDRLAELLKTQKSLTEWLQDIKHQDVEDIRKEDSEKRERLKILNRLIGLPIEKTTQFKATDLSEKTQKFKDFLKSDGDELCALRLLPQEKGLPKLRMRGKSVREAYKWFQEQQIDPDKYLADFIQHPPDYSWATIFIINPKGVQGEIIYGGHHQLTQGFHDANPPHIFRYDFKDWMVYPKNPEALAYLQELVTRLHVDSLADQEKIKKELGSGFVNNYLEGYFETTDSSIGTWFIDYSPTLGKMYEDWAIKAPARSKAHVKGLTGSPGKAEGYVQIIGPDNLDGFREGSILVCAVTTPDYVPLMQKAAAIVTDQGGILSHAAIVARELKKPCIVGTGGATHELKDGQKVVVDANTGVVIQ